MLNHSKSNRTNASANESTRLGRVIHDACRFLPEPRREPQRAGDRHTSGFGKNIFGLSTASEIATQRPTQAALSVDFIGYFSPERSLRNGVTAYTWSPRCTGLSGHRRLALVTQCLISASGDRDRTISPSASTRSSSRKTRPGQNVHRIPPPTLVTIAKRPSGGGGTRAINHKFTKNGS